MDLCVWGGGHKQSKHGAHNSGKNGAKMYCLVYIYSGWTPCLGRCTCMHVGTLPRCTRECAETAEKMMNVKDGCSGYVAEIATSHTSDCRLIASG
jgi:hypothetical protein